MDQVEQLNDAKRRYLDAKQEIETLRLAIAMKLCPLKVGDRIKVEDDGKEYEGIVQRVDFAVTKTELLDPVVGATPGWAVSGHRIKKTDGALSDWSFGFSNFNSRLDNGRWVIAKPDLNAIFGLTS